MVKITLVVAALLLTWVPTAAVADDTPEHKSKNARKALILLGHLGADTKEVRSFIDKIDSRIDSRENGDYLTFSEDRVGDGTLRLHYVLGQGLKAKNIELEYTPDNSNWRATARPDSVLLSYQYSF